MLPTMRIKAITLILLFACTGVANAQTIEGGFKHSLSVCSNKTAMAWGQDVYGQLGNSTSIPYSNIPVSVISLTGIVAISGGYYHTVALKDDGTVWAWGDNQYGQLGDATNTNSSVPVQVSSLTGITAICAGFGHSIALKDNGTVWAWGDNSYNQFGNGDFINSNVPVQISTLTNITAIAAGGYHTIALKNDHTIWACGYNIYGQIGSGSTAGTIDVPVQISSLTDITSIAAGIYHTIALKSDGSFWIWGFNVYGQLGNGTNTQSNVPLLISSMTNVSAIAGGEHHTLALKKDGTVWAWGWNVSGQLGDGTNTNSNVPVQITSLSGISAIGAGYEHSLFLKNDNSVWSCGKNSEGQLGDGTIIGTNVPIIITGLCPVITSDNEISEQPYISASPNPFTSTTTLISCKLFDNATLTVFNSNGQQVKQITNLSGQKIILNRDNLSCGLYYVRLTQKNKAIATGKVLIVD
jgi:alpha-tubulin suppressor-like RCC1 family protein